MMNKEMMIMINDRGMMKYQGFFMTEHSTLLKEVRIDYNRVEKINTRISKGNHVIRTFLTLLKTGDSSGK